MLLICCRCTAAYSVGAPKCPQCGSTEHVEQGSAEHEAMLAKAAETTAPKTRKSLAGTTDAAG